MTARREGTVIPENAAVVDLTESPGLAALLQAANDVAHIDLSNESTEASPQLLRHPPPEPPSNKLSHIKCVICLESPTDLAATPCGHLFCDLCIRSAIQTTAGSGGKCPVCRRKLTVKQIIPLEIKLGRT
ncbi:hypothetical protein SAICODRAFT_33678 [Saitoella complicata NRRL Y-17804]|nr:uncharacterized protein SAICODRAFT_33678 [Saitoella complicata NRRL Y-17804]ODQ55045.1 hypothetical protein SAICODRAFT_33678 [Saitoella complicata NRRL Y-17804]